MIRPLKIAVLDDEPVLVEVISLALQSFLDSVTILKFTDAVECLRELNRMDPDLLTLDWNMPKLDGGHVLDFLAQKGVTYPILIITGRAGEITQRVDEYKARGLNLSLLDKPFTKQQLWSRVEACFGDGADSVAA